MKRSLESILFGLSGIILSAALLVLLLTSAGCADGVTQEGDSFEICADTSPTCYADCNASETVDAVCDGGEWSCPDDSVDPDGPECESDTCEGGNPQWMCAIGCGGDAFQSPVCNSGEWTCPEGTTNVDDCPDDTCWGRPEGCRSSCVDEQSYVEPTCDEGTWTCEDSVSASACYSADCEVTTNSSLPGVTISIGMDTCAWTIYEVRDGFEIPYTIEVESPVEVRYTAQDAGGCGTRAHPLDPFYRFAGDNQQHCRCDVGLCMRSDEWVTIEPGTYELTVEWAGRNWQGPSDTGNEPGEVFPTGTYEFSVIAKGEYRDEAGEVSPYSVGAFMDFKLID